MPEHASLTKSDQTRNQQNEEATHDWVHPVVGEKREELKEE